MLIITGLSSVPGRELLASSLGQIFLFARASHVAGVPTAPVLPANAGIQGAENIFCATLLERVKKQQR